MLGISAYFQDLDYTYLERASEIGAKYLFTSLHIPEEDYSDVDEKMPKLIEKCLEFGISLIPDISPRTFEKLKVKNSDFNALKKLGFDTLRLDYGIEDFSLLKELLQDFKLILNASTINEKYIVDAKTAGIDFNNISLMHNFYPKIDTGISPDFFKSLNDVFLKYDIHIMAFIPGDDLKRFPLYEGLPTLEVHRHKNPMVSAIELIKVYGINDVLIGDSRAKLSTLESIQEYMSSHTLRIPAYFEPEFYNLYRTFNLRVDLADKVVRLAVQRSQGIDVFYNNQRKRGSITIENRLAGRYCGEMQITKIDMQMSRTANVVGFIHPDYVELLDYLDRDTKIEFIPL